MTISKGDRVELIELHPGQKLLGGFHVGQTGTVISTEIYPSEYPVIKWDTPVKITNGDGEPIEESDCHVSRLRKISLQVGDKVKIFGNESDTAFVVGISQHFKDREGKPLIEISSTPLGRIESAASPSFLTKVL
ncbi:MAG: hypothetical protein HWQ38_19065 [Nostoc sp. NMS7]|uniref:hypothetical protein n=1 Tax=Nostoc sp. NMS7 TaxID=2815391 RepID=UPI0025DC7877|nr:hypothetical protein [Nostoc sp. NMS7]MBN3948437.1 hypothetical protein [Nostoc sp. NMS7]